MKKIQTLLLFACTVLFLSSVSALEIVDVRSDYWAGQEIIHAIQQGYINIIDGNKFNPEGSMTRSEFVTALLKVIKRDGEPVVQKTSFKDISNITPNKKNILLSEQIRMVFGYPDKTFKPNVAINHNETMSMVSNISKPNYDNSVNLASFVDYKKIPLWAKRAYIKNVANGLYVNHPNSRAFTPTRNLTRAEAAVLFAKISQNLDKIQDRYKNLYNDLGLGDGDDRFAFDKATLIDGDDSLKLADFAFNDRVRVYDNKIIIEAGNVLVVTPVQDVTSKTDLISNEYVFTAPNDVYTTKGRFLYPKGTEFYAKNESVAYTKWRSKPDATALVFNKYAFPTGETYDMAGVPFTKDDKLIYVSDVKSSRKARKLANYKMSEKEFMIAKAHQIFPVVDYKIQENKSIFLLLTGDMVIPLNDSYFDLRARLKESKDNSKL